MEDTRDFIVGVTEVGESDALPTSKDFLLHPLVRLTEVGVNCLIDRATQNVEWGFWVRLLQVVEGEIQGVSNEEQYLMVYSAVALNSRSTYSRALGGT